MEIPHGACSLAISLAAATPDDSALKTDFYLDEVHAQFVIQESNVKGDE